MNVIRDKQVEINTCLHNKCITVAGCLACCKSFVVPVFKDSTEHSRPNYLPFRRLRLFDKIVAVIINAESLKHFPSHSLVSNK